MKTADEFVASLTPGLRILTLLISTIIWVMAVGLSLSDREMLGFSVLLLFGAWVIPLLYMVKGYRLEHQTLIIRRLCWDTRVDISDMRSVERIPKEHIQGSVRLLGNGGLFAICGWCWNRKLGRYRVWVTDDEMLVLIRCADRTLIVSPDRPSDFVKTVKRMTESKLSAEEVVK